MSMKKHTRAETGGGRRVNRNGIPVFGRRESLRGLFDAVEEAAGFEEGSVGTEGSGEPNPSPGFLVPGPAPGSSGAPKNRHGLPVLDREGSLKRLFEEAGREEETFAELVDRSLRGKDMDALLREKRERDLPGPVPLKKRLRRYPAPQEQLDLHGFTAARAASRTESFVRTAWRNGLFTVRIIVGRGLHSEFGAVLPGVAGDVLDEMRRQKAVLWFEWERGSTSDSGALIVYLNQFGD
jgi:DNA-nicking Smr family endonuclease